MKRLLFLLLITNNINFADAQTFQEGDNHISVGYGIGVIDATAFTSSSTNVTNTFTGPFYLKYEHALNDKMAIGINVAYGQYQKATTDDFNYPSPPVSVYEETYNTFSILARLNWHFGHITNFDPYWGFGVGYRAGTYAYSANNAGGYNTGDVASNFPLGFELTLGARYYLTDRVAIYMETGIAKSVAQVGLMFKLRKKNIS